MKKILFILLTLLPFVGYSQGGTPISNNFQNNHPFPMDSRTFKRVSGVAQYFTSVSEANNATNNPLAYRYKGMTIPIKIGANVYEYWYRDTTINSGLVLKTNDATDISALAASGFTNGDYPQWNGVEFVPSAGSGGGGGAINSNLTVTGYKLMPTYDSILLTKYKADSLYGYYDRIMLTGQSNELGKGKKLDLPFLNLPDDLSEAFDRVYIFNPQTNNYEKLQIGVNNQAADDPNYALFPTAYQCFGPEIGLAYAWVQKNASGLLFIDKNTADGQSITQFQPGTTFFNNMLARRTAANTWLAARGYKVRNRAFHMAQGETDYLSSQSTYAALLNSFMAALYSNKIVDSSTKIVLSNINPENADYGAGVAAAKAAYVAGNANGRLIQYMNSADPDNVHLKFDAQLQQGYDIVQRGFGANRILVYPNVVVPGFFPSGSTAYYKFEETSGNFLSTVGSFPLVRNNGASTVTGKIGNGAQMLSASNQYLSGSSSPTFSMTASGFTLTGWAKVTAGGVIQTILSKGTKASNLEYGLYMANVAGVLHFAWSIDGVDFQGFDVSATAPVGSLFFFAVRYDGSSTMGLSVNGGAFATHSTAAPYTGAGTFKVGYPEIGSGFDMNGVVDEVGLFPFALTNTEVLGLYNSGVGITHP